MKAINGVMGLLVLVLIIGGLSACATNQAGESSEQSAIVVNRIEVWKPVWNNGNEDIRKRYFDLPEFIRGIPIPMSSKGKRFYLPLKENNQTIGSIGIGENYNISDADRIGVGDNSPLKAFLKEKFSDYLNKFNLQEDIDLYKKFLRDSIAISVAAEFKPWSDSYEDKWKPHAKIAISEGRNGTWANIPSNVQERVYQIAKAMYKSGYLDELKGKKPNPNNMDIALEGRRSLVYGLPNDDTCYEINVRPSETLDKYLDRIRK